MCLFTWNLPFTPQFGCVCCTFLLSLSISKPRRVNSEGFLQIFFNWLFVPFSPAEICCCLALLWPHVWFPFWLSLLMAASTGGIQIGGFGWYTCLRGVVHLTKLSCLLNEFHIPLKLCRCLYATFPKKVTIAIYQDFLVLNTSGDQLFKPSASILECWKRCQFSAEVQSSPERVV